MAISPEYRGGERGEKLLDAIEDAARELHLNRLFVLTTRTAHWFIERGFEPTEISNLPNKKREMYNYQRNSKAFIKPLDQ